MGKGLVVLILIAVSLKIVVSFDVKHHSFTRSLQGLIDTRASSLESLDFIKIHTDQWNMLEDSSNPDFGKRHHFYIKYPDNCNACQGKALDILGEHHYKYVTPDVGIAFTTHDHMKSMLSDGDYNMLAYAPVASETKISNYVGNRCAEFNEHKERELVENVSEKNNVEWTPFTIKPPGATRPAPTMAGRILLLVAPLPYGEFEDFKTRLRQLASRYGEGKVLLDEHDFIHEKGTRPSYFQLNVPFDDDCKLTQRLITELSTMREVNRVEEMLDFHITNRWSKPICQTNNEEAQPITVQKKLDGTGQVVGILDTGIDMSSCYFTDPDVSTPYGSTSDNTINPSHRKVVMYMTYKDRTDDGGGHGSHVAGTVAGNSTKAYGDFVKYNGMVYNAKLAFFDIGDTAAGDGVIGVPSNLQTGAFDLLLPAGAYIITNSWGSTGVDYYSSSCVQVDQFMWDTPEALVLFANGNSGNTVSEDGSVNSPAGAKNVLSVGATLNAKDVFLAYSTSVPEGVTNEFGPNYLSYFSSRGPTRDGRIKPDVTAPGWWIVSAGSVRGAEDTSGMQCTIATLQGTSMSTPTVAGYAAMVRQYFQDGWYPTGVKIAANSFTPSGALLKAMLIHSSQPLVGITKVDSSSGETSHPALSSSFPNSDYGYGRILMNNILSFDNPNVTPNDPLSIFVVGGVKDGTSSNGGTLPDSNLYQECTTADIGTTKYFYVKTGTTRTSLNEKFDLKATLVYTDYPGTASTGSTPAIQNILDVSVTECGSGSTVTGTGEGSGSCSSPGNSYDSHLSSSAIVNPVAQVVVEEAADSTVFRVGVKCTTITHSPQPYSLVVTQDISELSYDSSDFPFAPYVSETNISVNTVSDDAKVIIVIFSILATILGILSYIIYSEHKRADALDEKDLDEQANQMAALQEQQMAQMRAEQGRR